MQMPYSYLLLVLTRVLTRVLEGPRQPWKGLWMGALLGQFLMLSALQCPFRTWVVWEGVVHLVPLSLPQKWCPFSEL